MSVGTGAAIAIAAGTTAASIYGAHKQASAANQASTQQQQAANRALDIQQQQYQQTRQDLAPYMGAGGQGLSALTSLLGVGAPAGPAAAAPAGQFVNQGAQPAGFDAHGRPLPGAPGVGPAPAGGGMVLLRAPTGQTQAVPADQASFFLARGATRA